MRAIKRTRERSKINKIINSIHEDGMNLQKYKHLQYDYNMSMIAIKQNGLAIQYTYFKDDVDMALAAVKQNGFALEFISIKNKKIYEEAVKQNKFAIQFVPINLRDNILQESIYLV